MPLDTALFAAFVVAAFALVASPGPDSLLILRYTFSSGSRAGLATVAGVQLGLLVHTLAAVLGLSVLILSVPLAFRAVAVAGAAYLAYLGVQSMRAGAVSLEAPAKSGAVRPAKACRDAILCNLLNPKVILLFLALMPNFVAPALGRVPLQLALLAAALIGINIVWQSGLVLVAERARRWLGDPRVQRLVSYITGGVLIAFAVVLLVEHGLSGVSGDLP